MPYVTPEIDPLTLACGSGGERPIGEIDG